MKYKSVVKGYREFIKTNPNEDYWISPIRIYSTIRYDKKLNQEIDKTLRRYNSKIDRLTKKGGYLLPQKVTKDDLMELSYTKKDLTRRLNNLEKFNKRGAEESVLMPSGYAISRYELESLRRERSRVKRNIEKELKYYETTKPREFGKEMATTFAKMGDPLYLNLQARYKEVNIDIENLPIDELIEYRKLLLNVGKSRDYLAENFKLNYIDMITDLGYYAKYDEKKLEVLKAKLMEIDPRKFYQLYINEKGIREVTNYYYTKIKAKKDVQEEKITELYDDLIDNMDTILKDYI